jgi:hypothetical protein
MQPRIKDDRQHASVFCLLAARTSTDLMLIAATTLNLVFIPVLYVIVRSIVPGRAAQAISHGE